LKSQLTRLRQADIAEAARRCEYSRSGHTHKLPVAFGRWLQARAWEFDGRENH
jgi:hypothetical protein